MRTLLLLMLVVPGLAWAQAGYHPEPMLDGYWEGAFVQEDGSIQVLKIDLREEGDGLSARFTVPDWGVLDAPRPVEWADGELTFDFFYGTTTLLVDQAAGEMRGLALRRRDSTTVAKVHLKRGPRPPRPTVIEEEVQFGSQGGVTMAGSVLLPEGDGPHPAILIVQGRGYGPRWGQYSEALRLARRGIACMIFDGRGQGNSGGDPATTTDEDRYADALAALRVLQARSDIQQDRIGLWGISAGGWIVPVVAERARDVAFLILDVGPAENLADQQGHVIEYRMRWFAEESFTEEDYQAAFAYQKKLVELSWEGAEWEAFEPLVAEARSQPWASYIDLPDDLNNAELDYFRRRPSFDPVPYLRRTTIPVFAIYGERDFVVPGVVNVPKLDRYLQEAGNQDVTIVVFPEARHGMNIPGGKQGTGEAWPESYFRWPRRAPGFYETLLPWLLPKVGLVPESM